MLLVDQIRSGLSKLSAAERKFADYALANSDIIYKTITEVIEESGCGYGTVIRYCKKLGSSGFQDFKIRFAFESAAIGQSTPNGNGKDAIARLAQSATDQIRAAARNLDTSTVDAIARILIRSRRILVVGVAGSHPTALEITYRLTRFGLNAICEADDHMQAIRASSLGKEDALVAVSFSGATKSVLDTVKVAKKAKATVIALCNYLRSPLVEAADANLLTALWEQALEAEIGSRIPFTFLIEVLTDRLRALHPHAGEMIKRTTDSSAAKVI